jgi:hypothetical protein
MSEWRPIAVNQKMFQNVAETSLQKAAAALENIYINDAGGHTRFPGLKPFLQIPGETGTMFVVDYKSDLIAVSSTGRTYRIDDRSNAESVTDVQLSGGLRPVFTKTEDELVYAAGGPILRFAGKKTELLSNDAPIATHVAYADGYLVANERSSGRFQYSDAGLWRTWDPLNILTAESNPDVVTAIVATPFRELMVAGPSSVEQFERLPDGTTPFYRRWAVGEGLGLPYTMVPADNGLWFVNSDYEFVRSSGQIGRPLSGDIQQKLDNITNWSEAWAAEMPVDGQKFMLLQLPHAINVYGTPGITMIFDYKNNRWSLLYGWDPRRGVPACWPGRSVCSVWNRSFVGGENGKIFELDRNTFTNDGQVQRALYRSGHYDMWGPIRCDGLRVRVARGDPLNGNVAPKFQMRINKDNRAWTRWMEKSLGARGDKFMFIDYPALGSCSSFQIEYIVTDPCRWELANVKGLITELGT